MTKNFYISTGFSGDQVDFRYYLPTVTPSELVVIAAHFELDVDLVVKPLGGERIAPEVFIGSNRAGTYLSCGVKFASKPQGDTLEKAAKKAGFKQRSNP